MASAHLPLPVAKMVANFILLADRILREGTEGPEVTAPPLSLRRALGVILVCGIFYGAVMGTFGGVAGERIWQVVFSAAKVPMLLLVTFVIALPSFFVVNTLLGVRSDFAEVLKALIMSQAGLAIVLAALAPFTVFWYASSADYPAAVLFNGVMFAVASFAGQWLLRRSYRPLVARSGRHRWLMRLWLFLYIFVGIQMAWILRPFVGYPGMSTQFFRSDTWGNAYVIILRMIWNLLGGR